MKLTLPWLHDHLETSATLGAITDTLTRIGLEVEHIDNPAAALSGFIIAHVLEAKQHPNADRLRVCSVDTGSGPPVQVVCGAPNAVTGMKTVFSPPGTYIPGKKITLGTGVIRGVESNGMLCSAAELELSSESDGIMELPDDAPVGTPYAAWAGLDQPVIDINLTPNRPDATGIHGIARDLAAAGLGELRNPGIAPVIGKFPCPFAVRLDFSPEQAHLAPAFALRLVRGIKNGPSPVWMQERLTAIGLRPINALVDITNYLTFDRGRPLHVFDAAKVHGALVVRPAIAGETIEALDGKTYTLEAGMVVIAGDRGVESIAGIMGGQTSGCNENTTDVLIESALWDAASIAQTGRKLGINTDARYRFERGVDPAFCVPGLELATHLVQQMCGGDASEPVLAGKIPLRGLKIDFPTSEVQRLTGMDIASTEMAHTLEMLGFGLEHDAGNSARWQVSVPSWRPDVEGKADLVEEVVRIAGLDRMVSTPLSRVISGVPAPVLTLLQKRTSLARRALAARGLAEAVTWSFISAEKARAFGGGKPQLQLANPIAADLSDMRPSLLPGLIACAQRNADRAMGDVALFEAGQVFLGDGERDQRMNVAALRRGSARPQGTGRHWSGASGPVQAHDAKADALSLLSILGVAAGAVQVVPGGPAWFHPGRCASLQFGPKNIIGHFGELHPAILELLDASGPMVAFEFTLDDVPAPKVRATKARPKLDLPELMPLERDFAFIVDASVKAADVLKAAQAADRALVTGVTLFDIYEGAGIAPGKKSLALAVTLQPRDKTLTDVEIDAVSARIIAEVAKKTGGSLRG